MSFLTFPVSNGTEPESYFLVLLAIGFWPLHTLEYALVAVVRRFKACHVASKKTCLIAVTRRETARQQS